jgi:hypothetical protein
MMIGWRSADLDPPEHAQERPTMQLVRTLLTAFSLIPLALGQAAADPTGPVTVVPAPAEPGPLNSPGVRLVKALKPNYSEQEYFVSGTATIYNYATNPPVRGDIVAIDELPYTTRMIVRRPQRAAHFNGTVVIEWWNTTATFDTAPTWDASAEYFARKGIVYVGVTNSSQVLPYLKLGCRILGLGPANCGEGRYDALSIPENGQAYEMLSQIATLLKSDSPANPLSEGFEVERIFHAGYSQQGGSLVTYASAWATIGAWRRTCRCPSTGRTPRPTCRACSPRGAARPTPTRSTTTRFREPATSPCTRTSRSSPPGPFR